MTETLILETILPFPNKPGEAQMIMSRTYFIISDNDRERLNVTKKIEIIMSLSQFIYQNLKEKFFKNM